MTDRTFLEIFWSGTKPVALALGAAGIFAFVHHNWKRSPLRMLSRGIDYWRAGVFQAKDCFGGARLRLARWPEHLDRARRER